MNLLKQSIKPLLGVAAFTLFFVLLLQKSWILALDIALCAFLLGSWRSNKIFPPVKTVLVTLLMGAVTGFVVYLFSPTEDLADYLFIHCVLYGFSALLDVGTLCYNRRKETRK